LLFFRIFWETQGHFLLNFVSNSIGSDGLLVQAVECQ